MSECARWPFDRSGSRGQLNLLLCDRILIASSLHGSSNRYPTSSIMRTGPQLNNYNLKLSSTSSAAGPRGQGITNCKQAKGQSIRWGQAAVHIYSRTFTLANDWWACLNCNLSVGVLFADEGGQIVARKCIAGRNYTGRNEINSRPAGNLEFQDA